MIVKESRIRTKNGAGALTRHVLRGAKNEAIRVLTGSDWLMRDQMREAHREGLKYGLRHIAFNPDEAMTDDQLSDFAHRLCDELKANPEDLTLVIHQKDGSTHGHLILPEWQQNCTLDSRFTWMRMEKIARLEEIRLGHRLVAGRHDRAIAKALRTEGHHYEGEQVEALIPVSHGAKPRSAYTSQARRITERQDLDLPALKKLVCTLWSRSDGLKAFRDALNEHNLSMRAGDRAEQRPGAHIIEDHNGTLIGSFTRLTKVRMAEFRTLLAEEKQQVARKPEKDIKSTRLPFRRTTANFYDEFPTPKASGNQLSLPKRPVIKRPHIKEWQRQLWLQRINDADTPTTKPLRPEFPVYILSVNEVRFRQKIKKEIAEQQAILDQQAPEASWKPLDKEKTLAKWCRQLVPYQKQLRESFDRYNSAKNAWQDAEKSRWHRMTGKSQKLEKIADKLFYEFLEVLRFIVEALLYSVGIRPEPPNPICTALNEKDQVALEQFKETHDTEFSVMADSKKLAPWLDQRFETIVQDRQKRFEQSIEKHGAKKEAARRKIEQLSTLLNTKPASHHLQAVISQHISNPSPPASSFGSP
ncbi:hypothetical protein [Acetobacter orleanensis]|uniref:Uncharacterized protein n=1 Tax=Acetobacter orleanensis TaxID=104099 RepID=A0A4Y3TQQ4_9PROT|nr:hypothetical protein [Acetobacter orleanensis]GAN69492.1 hypothetical protein Abol_038_002 [Acetobacter orleanensis JCM 7639]GBR26073.1 hypothetical protein AA0473_1052 [Acetobacter orleanensis NRIC 0473]GEB84104.1 hypothetical protein AOR01nite_25810 [Acetobacter orleanensis]